MELAKEPCTVCRPDSPKLNPSEQATLLGQLPEWEIKTYDGEEHLVKRFAFKDFKTALLFTIEIGELAESVNHHPYLITAWGNVTVHWWTHSIGGLHRNDFIMAAKTDQLSSSLG